MAPPLLFRIRLAARTLEASSAVLTVGTHSRCSIALKDPIASEEHCSLSWAQGSFLVEDLASATGTYLNGLAVEGRAPLGKGDVLVLGVTRMRVEDVGTSDAPLLELSVEESSFHYVATGAEGPKRDADNWVRWELAFGRLGGLRLAGGVTAALALLALAVPWLRPLEEAVLSAGPLRSGHAVLFERDEAALAAHFEASGRAPDAEFARVKALAEQEGCKACHAAFHGKPMSKCVACHAEKAHSQHPFLPGPAGPSELAFGGFGEGACAGCHSEHKGPQGANGPDRPGSGAASETCANCHTEEQKATALKRFQERIASGEKGAVGATAEFTLHSPEFSHEVHLAGGHVKCDDCHARAAGAGEFAPIRFEMCMRCHDEAVDPAAPLAAKMRVDIQQHGTDEDGALCKKCHVEPRQPGLREVTLAVEELKFQVPRRSHADVFQERAADCEACHYDGPPALQEHPVTSSFQHGTHLASLLPDGSTPQDQARASAACLECHAHTAQADGFEADRRGLIGSPAETCGTCHQDETGKPLSIAFATSGAREARTRVAFSHAEHAGVPGQCFTCHAFEATDDLFSARPTMSKTCVDCHDAAHSALGNGQCAKCHSAPADGRAPLAFRAELPRRSRPIVSGFSHFRPGHLEATQESGCTTCHAGIEQARDIAAIEILGGSNPVCVNCHIQEGALFHFQLPSR